MTETRVAFAPSESRIAALLKTMALPDKVRLLSGADTFSLNGDVRIGLDPIVLSDGPTGVRGEVVVGGRVSCLLPNASLLAQSWNVDLLDEVGDLLAEEAIDQHTHVVLGPTINLHRSPLGGRLFEAFSEDPLLTGLLAAAYVHGLQRRGIAATPKHFLGNESETQRTTVNAIISPEGLREAYLMPFQIVVEDAQPWALMAAYNGVNGVPSTEQNELINVIVKDEWGYDGLMMSDWVATRSTVESANGGLDLVMPGPDTPWNDSLVSEVEAGRVAEATVDDHLVRLLRLAARVDALHTKRRWETGLPKPDSPYRREQLRRLAAEGMVVLKNDHGTLPLRRDQSLALVGRHVFDTIAQGGGSAQVRPPHVISVAEGMASSFNTDHLHLVDGVETRQVLPVADTARLRDPETGRRGVRVNVYARDGSLSESRHLDVAELEDNQDGWLRGAALIEFEAAVHLERSGRVRLGVRGPGEWTITAPGHEEKVEITYHDGPGGGFFRPKSHATVVELEPGAVIRASVRPGALPRILGLVLAGAPKPSAVAIADAVRAAQNADTAVVVVGFTPDQETEGRDKATLSLPGDQDALVAAVASAARRTVVVLNAATPVLMPWLDLVDSVLFAGLPGQEAGSAIAAALTGEILPEGRLVTTFPEADGMGPSWSVTPKNDDLVYTEGTAVGYRGWHQNGDSPAFWFGHGLGYTEWSYEDTRAQQGEGTLIDRVEVTLRNVGSHVGRETVQIYARPHDARHPVRLIGWSQVTLAPGEASIVEVRCDPRVQKWWDHTDSSWRELGDVDLLVGRGLGDVRVTIPVPASSD